MKKYLLLAAMAVMAITASAQGSPKVYSGQPNDQKLTKDVVKKSFKSVAPRRGLSIKSQAPSRNLGALDISKVEPVARMNHVPMAAQTVVPTQGKAFSKGKAMSRKNVKLMPTMTAIPQQTAQAKAGRKAPALAEKYTGVGVDYRSKDMVKWTMTPGTLVLVGDVNGDNTVDVADISSVISVMAGTADYSASDVNHDGVIDVADISSIITIMANYDTSSSDAGANVLVDVIPTPDFLSELYPEGIPVKYTVDEDDVITIKPQSVAYYQNEAKDTTFYVTLFSATSDDEDGVINMEVDENGKLTITNGDYICYGEFANVEFDEEMSDGDAYLGWDELVASVKYYFKMEDSIDQEYNGHGVDYFENAPLDWVMQRGTTLMDDEEYHYFVNMSPLLDIFSEIYPDGIDVEYEQDGKTITVKPQLLGSARNDDGSIEYIMLCSGTAEDGCIVLTEGEDGSLATIDEESIIIGGWSTDEFDPTFDTYQGSYSYTDNVKYRLPDASPEAPVDVAFTPNELALFAGMGISGYHYNSNLGVLGAYAPLSFRNSTLDIATNFEWAVTEEDEEENTITGNERDFGFTTKGGAMYYDFSLTAYNQTEKSEPFLWGQTDVYASDSTAAYFYAGSGESSFQFSDDTYATMTRQNPDLDLTFYVNWATPDITAEYDATPISKIYSYQGKPSTPLFLTGVTLPMVDFKAEENFKLHIGIYKCTRSNSGRLTMGDLIAEADATIDNVNDEFAEQSGLTAVVFDELYLEDEFGMSETLDYLFIEDEFVIVIDDWDNGTFSGVLGSHKGDTHEVTSTWFEAPGEERLRSYGGGWPVLFIGLNDATYGYLYTEDNTDLQFGAEGGDATIHVDPMYYTYEQNEDGEYIEDQPTYSLAIESITVDGEELEEVPEWLTFEVTNEDYTTETGTRDDGTQYKYFVNGIDYDLVISVAPLEEDVKSRNVEVVFFQTGARLKVTVKQEDSELPE